MTDKEKSTIAEYRQAGYSYTQISKMMDLSINSIKTYCKRHDLGGKVAYTVTVINTGSKYENCGKDIIQNSGRKTKRFCCDKCRNKWRNEHMDQVKRKANYVYTCMNCKKYFRLMAMLTANIAAMSYNVWVRSSLHHLN
ncbi:MAG: RNA polymerase subunit sigma-70 [Agathobacter rectalis]|uniref:RNA polymerase subunit sigma-70 n=1 Tax=Agathobacter rectalis TaxID=39491 RepID=UPI0034A22DC5